MAQADLTEIGSSCFFLVRIPGAKPVSTFAGCALGSRPIRRRSVGVDERAIRKIEGHLRGTFANARITLVPRPKQKDSAEVYIGEEFIGVVFQDEDEDGSYMFEMAILAEDLP
jgi:hypothetical protein